MTTSHTPGPWKVFDSMVDSETYGIDGADGTAVVFYGYKDTEDGIRKKADAVLIAAAPELLNLLSEAVQLQRKHYGDGMMLHMEMAAWVEKASAAIAKAKGEQQ
ncbi:hypothetical protein WJ973_23815 [Achromobacter xylosoxidans]